MIVHDKSRTLPWSSRLRVAVFATTCVMILTGSDGSRFHGQAPAPRRVFTQKIAVGAVDRGLVVSESRAPDSEETRLRRSVTRADVEGGLSVPGRVVVKFRDGVSSASRIGAMSAVSRSASLMQRPAYANFDLVRIDASEDAEAVARAFSARGDVEYSQAVHRFHTYLVPNDRFYREGLQWSFPAIDLERGWDIQPGATSSIIVAVVDSGVAFQSGIVRFNAPGFRIDGRTYPPLGDVDVPFAAASELAAPGRFVAPRDFIWDDADPFDLDGHGTHVAGTVGQLTNNNEGTAGVAFNVRLMPVKVIDGVWDVVFGSPFEGTDDVVARGVRYAADNGAKVINMSIGRSGPPSPVVEDAIRYAVSRGAFVAIAAGNSFEEGNPPQVLAQIASRVEGAVSVAATDRQHNRAFYSTTGSYVELSAPGGSFRGFGGPGGILQQTFDLRLVETYLVPPSQYGAPRFDAFEYFYFTGTSQATPHVAGLAALLMQQGITSPAAIEAAMTRFAVDRGPAGRDDEFGFGEIHARNTLRGLGLAK
jgi:serine protease